MFFAFFCYEYCIICAYLHINRWKICSIGSDFVKVMNIITGKEVKSMEERLLTESEEEEINEINYEEDLVECETVGSY